MLGGVCYSYPLLRCNNNSLLYNLFRWGYLNPLQFSIFHRLKIWALLRVFLSFNSDDRAFIHSTMDSFLQSRLALVSQAFAYVIFPCPQKQLHCYYFYNLMSNGNYNIMRFPFHGICTTAIIAMNIIMLGSCGLHLIPSIVSIFAL